MATLNYNWQLIAEAGGSINGNTCNVRIYAKINSQSVANNNSSVSYQSRLYYSNSYGFSSYDPTTKSISGTGAGSQSANAYGTYGGGETVLQTITGVVGHNASGNANVSMSANFNAGPWGYNVTVNGSASLPKINRVAITNSVTGSDIEQEFKVNYTKYINNYQYKLRISIPNVRELDRINYNTSDEVFTLSQSTIETLYQKYTTTNTFNLGFRVETWNGNTMLSAGNEKIVSCKITGNTPIFTDFDYNDINQTTLALTGNSKYNINGYSTIRVLISQANKAIAQKGATMKEYQLIIGSQPPKSVPYSDDSDVYIDLPNASTGEYKVYAIDSRNNSTLVTKLALQNINYEPLYIDRGNSNTERDDGGIGENVTLNYRGTIWNDSFGDISNSITIAKYEFKKVSDSVWITGTTNITPTILENNLSFSGLIRSNETGYKFPVQDSYNFRITLQDKLSETTVELTPLPSGIPNISLNKNGVGIMCDYDESLGGLLQIGGEVFNPMSNKLVGIATIGSSSISSGTFNTKDFSSVNIIDSEYLKVESNVLKCKKAGNYKFHLKLRFADVTSGNPNVFAGITINNNTSDDSYGTWANNGRRLTVNDFSIRSLSVNDTIKLIHQGSGVSTDAINKGTCWIEYIN